MELKKELLEFLEANNLFGLEDRENAEGVVDSYLKVYKKQLTLTSSVSQAKRTVCPDCFDRGELRNDKEEIIGTCPCHY